MKHLLHKTLSYFTPLIFGAVITVSCLGGGNSDIRHFVNAYRLLITSRDVTFENRSRRLSYVSNFSSGTIAVVDLSDRDILDLDDFDGEETPLTVGGKPTEIFEWQPASLNANTEYKLVVVDQENQRLIIIDVNSTTVEGKSTVTHSLVSTSGSEIGVASKPVFVDRGRRTNSVISDITNNAVDGEFNSENWRVKSKGDDEWEVEGSVSGKQTRRAISGTPYTSDSGAISFTIQEGDLPSTSDDLYLFGTNVATPLPLPGTPSASTLVEDKLYVVDRDNQQLVVVDLINLVIETTVALTDGSPMVLPTEIKPNDPTSPSSLILTNRESGNSIFRFNLADSSVDFFTIGQATSRVFIDATNQLAYLLPVNDQNILAFDIAGGVLDNPPITMANTPLSFAFLSGDEDVDGNALVGSQDGLVDLVDLDNRTRVDTRERGDAESFAGRIHFIDLGENSEAPQLTIVTIDGHTVSERWSLIYEGGVGDTVSATGDISGATLSDTNGQFLTNNVKVGDALVISTANSRSREEISITAINSETSISLANSPATQGTGISYQIEARNEYILVGSRSGVQNTRFSEGTSDTSDDGEIRLILGFSTGNVDRGDYFSFETDDGITAIGISGSYPVDLQVFNGEAFTLNQTSDNISVIDISSLRFRGSID